MREQLLAVSEDDEVEWRDAIIAYQCHLAELDESAAPPDEFAKAVAWVRKQLERLDVAASRMSSHRAVVEEFDCMHGGWTRPPGHRPFKENAAGRARRHERLAMQDAA